MTAFLLKDRHLDQSTTTIAGLKVEEDRRALNSVEIRAKGIFINRQAESRLKGAALYGEELPFELSFENGERLRAKFAVTEMSYAGIVGGEANYRVGLKSVGAVECPLNL